MVPLYPLAVISGVVVNFRVVRIVQNKRTNENGGQCNFMHVLLTSLFLCEDNLCNMQPIYNSYMLKRIFCCARHINKNITLYQFPNTV